MSSGGQLALYLEGWLDSSNATVYYIYFIPDYASLFAGQAPWRASYCQYDIVSTTSTLHVSCFTDRYCIASHRLVEDNNKVLRWESVPTSQIRLPCFAPQPHQCEHSTSTP